MQAPTRESPLISTPPDPPRRLLRCPRCGLTRIASAADCPCGALAAPVASPPPQPRREIGPWLMAVLVVLVMDAVAANAGLTPRFGPERDMTRAEYTRAADSVCRRYDERLEFGGGGGDAAQTRRWLARMSASGRLFLADWDLLDPPAALRDGHDRVYILFTRWVDDLETILVRLERDDDLETALRDLRRALGPASREFSDVTAGMGLAVCAGADDGGADRQAA